MASKSEKPFIIEPCDKHTATVIFLHGEGNEPLYEWAEKLAPHVEPTQTRIIIPRAATIGLHDGTKVPGWFNVFPDDYKLTLEDTEGMKRTYEDIVDLIQREIKGTSKRPGIPASRIVLAGFSQGGSMAYWIGIHAPFLLGGVINLSGYFPNYQNTNWDEVRKPPLMVCQGDSDFLLPVNYLMGVSRHLRNCLNVIFHIYDEVEHETCEKEWIDVEKFITSRIPPLKN